MSMYSITILDAQTRRRIEPTPEIKKLEYSLPIDPYVTHEYVNTPIAIGLKRAIENLEIPAGILVALECQFSDIIASNGAFGGWRYLRTSERFWYEFGHWSIPCEPPCKPVVEWSTLESRKKIT